MVGIIGAEHYRRRDVMAERTSIHEAAHSVIGRALGFDCGAASIRADGTGSAAVAPVFSLHWDVTRGDILSSVLDKLTVCWAGPLAEIIVFGNADDRGNVAQIKSLATKYYVQDRDIAAARERARGLLVLHWDKVEAVAATLLEKKTLTGGEIDALVHDNVTTRRGGSQPL